MKIQITLDVHGENVDSGDETGLTEEAYMLLMDRLGAIGDVDDVERIDG